MKDKENQFKMLIEETTDMHNHNLHVAVQSASMIKQTLLLFTDDPKLKMTGKKLYNQMVQDIASQLVELCFIEQEI